MQLRPAYNQLFAFFSLNSRFVVISYARHFHTHKDFLSLLLKYPSQLNLQMVTSYVPRKRKEADKKILKNDEKCVFVPYGTRKCVDSCTWPILRLAHQHLMDFNLILWTRYLIPDSPLPGSFSNNEFGKM